MLLCTWRPLYNIGRSLVQWKPRLATSTICWNDELKDAERKMKYALQLHEKSAMQDLDTVSRYMLLLEHKIQRKSLKRMRMVKEKEFLKTQAELLQYTEE